MMKRSLGSRSICNQFWLRHLPSRLLIALLLAAFVSVISHIANASAPENKALVEAIQNADWELASTLLNQHDRIDSEAVTEAQPDGMTALHWAARHGNSQWTQRLLKRGAVPDAVTGYGITPLSIACQNGDLPVAKALLDAGADPNHKLPGDMSCLILAARTGNAELVRELLRRSAVVDDPQREGQTALMFAAADGHADVIDVLVAAGADIHRRLESGFTPMLFAAREGRIAAVTTLLDHGVDINLAMQPKRTNDRNPRKGMTALMLAVESAHFKLAMQLIQRGADPNDEQSEFAPLHAVSWVRRAQLADNPSGDPEPRGSGGLDSLGFVREIVAQGADVNLRLRRGSGGGGRLSTRGATPLLLACHTVDLPLIQLLLELGADPKLTNHDGTTTLLAAAGIGVTNPTEGYPGKPEEVEAAIRLLLGLGLDINHVDNNGETAMHGAAYRCFPETVQLVAQLGADRQIWNQKNRHGWTPLLIAQGYRPGSFKPEPPTIEAIMEVLDGRAGGNPRSLQD